jgi:hypothetical protein
MKTPIVSETPLGLEPVTPDPFLDGLDDESSCPYPAAPLDGSFQCRDHTARRPHQPPPSKETR